MSKKNLIFAFVLLILIPFVYTQTKPYWSLEGYSNYTLEKANGPFPQATYEVLADFPITHKYGVSTAQGSSIWKDYPIYQAGSYKQITNNHKYVKQPDNGTCMAAEMCNTLYQSRRHKSNQVFPLPPVCVGAAGSRVNYYNTEQNLSPFTTDDVNILY